MTSNNRFKKAAASLFAAAIAAISPLSAAFGSSAAGELANERVNYDKSGVLQVEVWYHPAGMDDICLQTGSAFLINRSTLLTCAHVFDISQDTKNWIVQKYSKGDNDKHEFDDDYLHYEIAILGDNKKPATIREKSNDNDYAVLSIDAELSTKVPLWLGDSEKAQQTQDVFALGFPAAVEVSQQHTAYTPYTAEDVTVTKGSISKTGFVFDDGQKVTTNLIQHNATISGGNSGGPLVDADGVVMGINAAIGNLTGFSYAIEINKVKELLDLLNIEYNNPQWRPEWIDGEGTEKASDAEENEDDGDKPAATAASGKTASDVTTKKASEDKETDLTPIIIAGIVAASALIILLVIVMLVKSGKKPASLPAAAPPQGRPGQPGAPGQPPQQQYPGQQPYQQQPPQPRQYAEQAVYQPQSAPRPDMGAGETSILEGSGAGETSLLASNGAPGAGATMVRKRNGAAFSVNLPEFIIGKERDKVDYCVNNNAVSRRHAKITVSGGKYFITDLNSSNYSYINGRRIPANAPQLLHSGDIVKLADEEFEFRG